MTNHLPNPMPDIDINPNKHSLTNHKASNNLSSKILALNHRVGTVVGLIRKDTVPLKVRNLISATNYLILKLFAAKSAKQCLRPSQALFFFVGALDVQVSIVEPDELSVHEICNICGREEDEEWNAKLYLTGGRKFINIKIDTGAKCNVISLQFFKSLKVDSPMMCPSGMKLLSYSGDKIDTCGEVLLECTYRNIPQKIHFYVVSKPVMPIVGLQTCLKEEEESRFTSDSG